MRGLFRRPLAWALFIALPSLAAYFYVVIFRADAKDLWKVPGRDATGIRDASIPGNWAYLLKADDLLVTLLMLSLILIALNYDLGRQSSRHWTLEPRHWALTALAIFGYSTADYLENSLLRRLLPHQPSVTASEARHLAILTNAKWGLLAASAILCTSCWSRRPRPAPHRISAEPFSFPSGRWYEPNRAPEGSDWAPDPQRFGVAVSGGGVRSASFALGALEALRAQSLLSKARYVASVSGGSYATSAFTALHQPASGTDGALQPAPTDPFGTTSPELQAVRRNLRYLISNRAMAFGAIARITLGLLLNLLILYSLAYVAGRPLGWLVGTPAVHPELRLNQPSVVSVDDSCPPGRRIALSPRIKTVAVNGTNAPSLSGIDAAATEEPVSAGDLKGLPAVGQRATVLTDGSTWTIDVPFPDHCIELAPSVRQDGALWRASFTTVRPAVVSVDNGKLTVVRQPFFAVSQLTPLTDGDGQSTLLQGLSAEEVLDIRQPTIKVSDPDAAVIADSDVAGLVEIDDPGAVIPGSVFELRDPLDIRLWQWVGAAIPLGLASALIIYRIIKRPDSWQSLNRLAGVAAALGAVWFAVFIGVPWLVDILPRGLMNASRSRPSDGLLSSLNWLPGADQLPVLILWPLLSISAVGRFFKSRKAAATPANTTRPRNAAAFVKKYTRLLSQVAVSIAVIVVGAFTLITIVSGGALNGPHGQRSTYAHDFVGLSLEHIMPPDWLFWVGAALLLASSPGWSESSAWSPQPIYKRCLSRAFHWSRIDGQPESRQLDTTDFWADLSPWRAGDVADAHARQEYWRRAGFLDGEVGDGTELVLCCAASVLGSNRAPTGRSAVSFTASRSWIGGPEIGWMRTATYLRRLSGRRRRDLNLPGLTSLSGAAVGASMGSQSYSPYGRILAVMNLRLGAWLPNPSMIQALGGGREWHHNPGWPWFLREVRRRYEADAPYYYVSDGGHWENLGLVEALRRGCMHVVVISAAGDGELSSGTLAQAVEIARSDLGVEVVLDEVWRTRPKLGGETPTELPSGRQYILEPGPTASVGRAAPQGYAFGRLLFPNQKEEGSILLIEASMVDGLPLDVHSYAEANPEFPNVSTGDQLFADRDFDAYRMLGARLVGDALSTYQGQIFARRVGRCTRHDS